ncbi:receptor-interacting serine threonine- kinase 2 [Pelobates cultripes]|uniref:Receptor-interacting serine/threonine-protein kinase 2 n=1 Tax=Pelobates cultripes TaxID=61616 RepID=A0AAD1S5T4_PELCU|nr:receptor-interacting serine threonine- kinase 2 [Pelobates cultripes]
MSSSGESMGSASPYSSDSQTSVGQREQDTIQPTTISSALECIPCNKLVSLEFINKGAYGTVYRASHEDWRVLVAVKYFPTERHLVEVERNKILKEAEILHKARFSYILPILGICNENGKLGIVTEYMTSGSLNQLLHEENPSLEIAWPLRFRILYEIALGVNFLHNMNPPLLHHDLKTHNILLDNDFHVKIADFGLSKWRMLSSSQSLSDHSSPGGTIVYMPPEVYIPNAKNKRGSVKHDMYSYAIIMWEVLTRKQPYEGAINPIQIMYTVSNGNRPEISEDSLPVNLPHRDVFISLMHSGWAKDPDERPAFLKCLLDLEPIIGTYDEISILEAILMIKKVKKARITSNHSIPSSPSASELHNATPEKSIHSSNEDVHRGENETAASPHYKINSIFPHVSLPPTEAHISIQPSSSMPFGTVPSSEDSTPFPKSFPIQESSSSSSSLAKHWVQLRRLEIVNQMTEACLNQCLDALISRAVILKEDYEQIKAKSTRSSKVRQLIDTSDIQGEAFARIIVEKLRDNRQNDLRPFPEI